MALKPRARNPRGIGIAELFVRAAGAGPRTGPRAPHQMQPWSAIFGAIDRVLRLVEPLFPEATRRRAIDRAVAFVIERLNGEDGLGAIFPAMANTVMMFECLGYPDDDPRVVLAARAPSRSCWWSRSDEAYCQPCLSPVWDTALVCHALMEVGGEARRPAAPAGPRLAAAAPGARPCGDWAAQRPNVRPGGWAFQYANPHYPDLDDTAVVVMAMDRRGRQRPARDYAHARSRAGANGSRGCRAATAAGAPSTPTTTTTI